MTEAKLSQEIDAQLIEQAASCEKRPGPVAGWQSWFLAELRAAAAVGVEGMEAELAKAHEVLRSLACWLSVGGYNCETVDPDLFEKKIREGIDYLVRVETERARGPQISDSEQVSLLRRTVAERDAELAALRKHEPTTPEEANQVLIAAQNATWDMEGDAAAAEIDKLRARPLPPQKTTTSLQEAKAVYEAWRSAYIGGGSDWTSGMAAMAAAIDKLRERPLPTSGGGMTVEERVAECAPSDWPPSSPMWQAIKEQMERAVAEAVAIKEKEWEQWRKEWFEANQQSDAFVDQERAEWQKERVRHAKELLEAIAAERARCARIAWDMQMSYFGGGTAIGNEIQDSEGQSELAMTKARHAAELKKCESDYERVLLEAVDEQSKRHAKELQEAVAAAYDYCQTLSQDELYKHVAKQDFHGAAGCRSCVDAIKMAAERAAAPQEPSTPQVSESSTLPRWCPECKCTPPAHDSDCSATPQEQHQGPGGIKGWMCMGCGKTFDRVHECGKGIEAPPAWISFVVGLHS